MESGGLSSATRQTAAWAVLSAGTLLSFFWCGLQKLKPLLNITQLMCPKLPVLCPKHLASIYKGRSMKASPLRGQQDKEAPRLSISAVSTLKGQHWQTALTFQAAEMSVSGCACCICAAEFPLLQRRERGQWLLSNASFCLHLSEPFIASLWTLF